MINGHLVTSRGYSRALIRLRDLHRDEFDELYQQARIEVADELDIEAAIERDNRAGAPPAQQKGNTP